MKVTLCVKKIYNTLIYIIVKYYKLYNNTYIKKKFNYEKKKKNEKIFCKKKILLISLIYNTKNIYFFSFQIYTSLCIF